MNFRFHTDMGGKLPALFSAPHRMLFFAGSIQILVTLLFWTTELMGRYTSLWPPLNMVVPGVWAHSYIMLYGLYPFFIFGFLMTTFPRWLDTEPVPKVFYIAAFLMMLAGCLVFNIALLLSRTALILSVFIHLSGWVIALIALFRVYLKPHKARTIYEPILLGLLILGLLCGLSGLVWLSTQNVLFYQISLTGGLWLFLLPVIITVAHRMIPFFNSTVMNNYMINRPAWSLPLMAAFLAGHLFCVLLDLQQWLFLFDLPLGLAAAYHSVLWRFRDSLKVPLLAMLHISFLWLPAGLLLSGAQSLLLLSGSEIFLGKAPVHALGIGFITSMTLAMAARVSFGHSGRPLIASRMTLACFWLVQLCALCRIAGEIIFLNTASGNHWILLAAVIWIVFSIIWACIYLPIYIMPRIDGKPG